MLPASFVNCTYGKVTDADRTAMGKVTSSSSVNDLPDAAGVRLTRAADQCDATLTNQLIETSVFTGAPASISAAQKSCATTKIIAAIAALDDTKLKGTSSSEVSNAAGTRPRPAASAQADDPPPMRLIRRPDRRRGRPPGRR